MYNTIIHNFPFLSSLALCYAPFGCLIVPGWMWGFEEKWKKRLSRDSLQASHRRERKIQAQPSMVGVSLIGRSFSDLKGEAGENEGLGSPKQSFIPRRSEEKYFISGSEIIFFFTSSVERIVWENLDLHFSLVHLSNH